MSSFSVSEAAFAGYRLLRKRPTAIIWWAVFQAAAYVLWVGLTVTLTAVQRENLDILQNASTTPPGETLAAMVAVGPMFLVLFLAMVIASAVLQTAIYRAFLRPDDSRWGYLRLGWDEVRISGVMFALAVLLVVFVLVVGFALILALNLGDALPVGLRRLLDIIVFIVLAGVLAFASVRFSLAVPATFAKGEIYLRRAWRMTRGYEGRLLAAYVLMYASVIVAAIGVSVVAAILAGIIALMSGGGLEGVGTVLRGESAAALPLPMLLFSLVFSIFQVWLVAAAAVVQIGPSAEAYREIAVLEAEAAQA